MAELTLVQKAQAEEAERINAGGEAALAATSTLHPDEQVKALNNALQRLRNFQVEQAELVQLANLKAKYPGV